MNIFNMFSCNQVNGNKIGLKIEILMIGNFGLAGMMFFTLKQAASQRLKFVKQLKLPSV